MTLLTTVEICAGAGGQALGLELAGFEHKALIEIDRSACETLRINRPTWNVIQENINNIDGGIFKGIDLLAGGVPCPPFSIAGKQLGADDERDLFPAALRLVDQIKPNAVMLENVRGLADAKFSQYRFDIISKLKFMGYWSDWKLISASEFGVPQLRPRFVLVALKTEYAPFFAWPVFVGKAPTVGEALRDLMALHGWAGADVWASSANSIAPTIVGGSKKHGGPDLGPTRARQQWARLGVDGRGLADSPPGADVSTDAIPRLTLRMVARLQGFPDSWAISGRKTPAYRQIGNAFPPPVALAIGTSIRLALQKNEAATPNVSGLQQLPLIDIFSRVLL
jgi:DNA (cytosine-5)-methyltransferase 1